MNNTLSQDIVREWGLQSLPPEKQTEMADRIGRLMYQAVLVRALDILSDKEQTEFDLLLEENDTTPTEVLAFLQSKIPTFEQLANEERNKLKADFLLPISA